MHSLVSIVVVSLVMVMILAVMISMVFAAVVAFASEVAKKVFQKIHCVILLSIF
jgi:hypothetical protein